MIEKELLKAVLAEQMENFVNKELGVPREVLPLISKMTKTPHVVVITGLRRVGKSTLLTQIASKYLNDNYYYVSFEDERLTRFEVSDFDILYETLVEMWGEKKIWLMDEIQNVVGWERFVRHMHDIGHKLYITGSNASLLSEELATRLTGRSLKVELFPFSFKEYLVWCGHQNGSVVTTKDKGKIVRLINHYISGGGIPESLQYPDLNILSSLYNDVLHRDIVSRYQIENVRSLKEMAHYLASNVANLVSFNKMKELLKLGSVNTVKSYFDYLESSWLFFVVNKFAYSVKEQQIAAKKVYCIDSGLAKVVGFNFSKNQGRWIENLVYLQLRRYGDEVFYFKTQNGDEVDYYLPKQNKLIQVTHSLENPQTRQRELSAITQASREIKVKCELIVITERERGEIEFEGNKISILPIFEWLGGDSGK